MMRTARALWWESWRRGRAGPVSGVILLLFYVGVLHWVSYITADSLPFQYAMLWLEMVWFSFLAAGLMCEPRRGSAWVSGFPSRQYLLPVSTPWLVACPMLFGATMVAAMHLTFVAIVRVWLGVSWPAWGPALFLALTAACMQAVIWSLADFPIWRILAACAVATPLAFFLASRFGAEGLVFPTRAWELRPGEALVLGLCMVLAYVAAVGGVRRDRRGDARGWPGWAPFLEGVADALPGRRAAFATPAGAQFWFEWRLKGIYLPRGFACLLCVAVLCCLFGWIKATDLLFLTLIGLGALAYVSFPLGIFFGWLGPNRRNTVISTFRAVRPLGDQEIAAAILKTGAASLGAAWALLTCAILVEAGWLVLFGQWPVAWRGLIPKVALVHPSVWLPALILGLPIVAWTLMALFASWSLTGGNQVQRASGLCVFLSLFSFFTFHALARKYNIPQSVEDAVDSGAAVLFGLVCLVGTGWAYAAARRRGFIASRTQWIAFGAWLVLSAAAAAGWILRVGAANPAVIFVLLPGLLALPFTPLAAAPLALAWNRHR